MHVSDAEDAAPVSPAISIAPRDAAEYVYETCVVLETMTLAANLPFLAYLLELVQRHAHEIVKEGRATAAIGDRDAVAH